jgi:hypothetical protein
MSNPKNYLIELPKRCNKLVQRYFEQELNQKGVEKLEVTLLLSLATPVFCFSNEIEKREEFSNKINFGKHTSTFNELFLKSSFIKGISQISTRGKAKKDQISLLTTPTMLIKSDKKVGRVIGIIRNALAHGNVQFVGNPNIERIRFCSAKFKDDDMKILEYYHYLELTINDFKVLLKNWCDYLITLDKDIIEVPELLKNAA